jgi:hypothetical protein
MRITISADGVGFMWQGTPGSTNVERVFACDTLPAREELEWRDGRYRKALQWPGLKAALMLMQPNGNFQGGFQYLRNIHIYTETLTPQGTVHRDHRIERVDFEGVLAPVVA